MGSRESIDERSVRPGAAANRLKRSADSIKQPLHLLGSDESAAPCIAPLPAVVVGELIALADDGYTPLVLFPGQPGTSALRARTVLDLHALHIGRQVVLMFDGGEASRPMVMGVLCPSAGWQLRKPPGLLEVDTDGRRLVVSAKEQLLLRCGKASITLTSAGKVLIQGSYLLSRSTGANRVKGGSVQLN